MPPTTKAKAPPRRAMHILRYASCKDYAMYAGAFVTVMISGANQPAQLIIFGNLLDSFNNSNTAEAVRLVHFFAMLYAIVAVQQLITITTQTALATRVAAAQARRCREKYFAAILSRPIAWFDQSDQGAVGASVLESTLAIQDGLGEKLATAGQGVFAFLFGLAVSLYYAWSLALVSVGALPVVVLLLGLASKMASRANAKAADESGAASAIANEALVNVRTVAAFGGEKREMSRYAAACARAADATLGAAVSTGANAALVSCILYGTWALGLWYGSYLIRQDMKAHEYCNYRTASNGDLRTPSKKCISGGDVMTSFLCILFGGLALLQALPGIAAYQLANSEAQRVFKVIDEADASALTDAADAKAKAKSSSDTLSAMAARGAGTIAFVDVRFSYPARPDRPVCAGLCLDIAAGTTCALVGPSGCGKSTVVQLLLRFYEVDGGAVLVDGVDARTLDVATLRSKIGLVAQEPVLFTGTIFENIALGREGATRADCEGAARLANAFEFIKGFPEGFDTEVGDCGVKLSGGQRQRVAIARALVRDPEILVLDEATSALDSKSERVVQEALDAITASKARTTLVIAHRLSTIRRADQICVLNEGTVAEKGTHDELMAKGGAYKALVEAQVASADGTTSVVSVASVEAVAYDDVVLAEAIDDRDVVKADDVEAPGVDRATAAQVVRWLWATARDERPFVALGVVGSAIGGATQPLLGFLMAEFLVAFFNHSTSHMRREARFWALMFVAMAGVAAIGELWKSYGLSRAAERVVRDVRTKSFEAMVRQPISWHDAPERSAGALSSRLAQDTQAVRALVGQRIALSVAMVVIVVGGLGISFDASWRLTLVTLGIIPLIVLPIAVTGAYVAKVAEAAQESLVRAGGIATEAVLHMRTVRAYGIEGAISRKFDDFLELPERQAIRKGLAGGLGAGVAAATILLGAAFQYYIGGIFFRKGWVSFSDLMTVLLVIIFMAFGIGAVAGDSIDKAEAMTAAKKAWDVVHLKSSIDALAPLGYDGGKGGAAATVSFEDVAFAYPTRVDRPVYERLTFSIAAGEVCALVGESGAGKSTAVQLLLRYYDVGGGRISVDGTDVRDWAVDRLRASIGLVSQEPALFTGSIADNIKYGKPNASLDEVRQAASLANALTFIDALPEGFDTQVGSRGVQLSGGQKQRVAIARAIVRNPRLLILDEATSALDSKSERVVQAALDGITATSSCTTLVIAHRLSTIRSASKICVFGKGGLLEEGTHDRLLAKKSHYYALVAHQMAK